MLLDSHLRPAPTRPGLPNKPPYDYQTSGHQTFLKFQNIIEALFPQLCIRLYLVYTCQPQAVGEQGWPQGVHIGGNRCYPSVKKNGKPGRNEPTGNKQNQLPNSATRAGGEGDCPIIKDLGNPHEQHS